MTKIGAHVSGNPRLNYESFCKAKPAVVLGLNDSGCLIEAKSWSIGFTWTLYRTTEVYGERPADLHNPPGTYAQMAHYWYQEASPSLKGKWSINPADIYIPDNEPGGGEGTDVRQNYKNVVAYERELMKLANADGYKLGVLANAGGSPGDFSIWTEICVPFIKEAYDSGNFYVRHAYENNWDRVYKEAQYLIDNGLGYGGMVVSEWGFCGGYGQLHDVGKIEDEDATLGAFPNVIGFCIWELGKTEFNANFDSKIPQLVPYMQAHPTDKWQPGQPETETFEQKAWAITAEMQRTQRGGLQLNPEAGLEIQIDKDDKAGDLSLQIVTSETTVDGKVVQAAESRTGKVRRRVYVWDNGQISWFNDPDLPDNLAVSPLSQRDTRWASNVLGQDTGHTKTIGNWGCLLVDYCMMARYLGLTTLLPGGYNTYMVSKGCFSSQYLLAAALRTAHPDRVTYQGYASREDTTMLSKIRQSIDNSIPVPARVDFRPSTESWEQHWVLLIGYDGSDFTMADPWTGKIGSVAEAYGIPGIDILEALFYGLKTVPDKIDLMPYISGDGRRYYLKNQNGTTQELLQCQQEDDRFYQVKNEAWESFSSSTEWIYRDKDTSPGGGRYYTQREGNNLARWLPRKMSVGEEFVVSLRVQFYNLSDCTKSAPNSGDVTNTMKFVAHHPQWVSRHGIALEDVIEIQWVNGGETYLYAKNYGLVEWSRGHSDPNSPEWTSISELVQGGTNKRMNGCYS